MCIARSIYPALPGVFLLFLAVIIPPRAWLLWLYFPLFVLVHDWYGKGMLREEWTLIWNGMGYEYVYFETGIVLIDSWMMLKHTCSCSVVAGAGLGFWQ